MAQVVGAIVVVLALVAIVRALLLSSPQVAPGTPSSIAVDIDAAAQRLATGLSIPTVSWGDVSRRDTAAFDALHRHLTESFPRVAASLKRETLATYSLLYTWVGTRGDLPPLVFLAHLDVVPAVADADANDATDSSSRWTHPPFAGAIASGKIWGRGAIDDKSSLFGILEAVEALLTSGFKPERTIYLAFSHNEEGGGDESGARQIAQTLASRGVHDAWLLDEGGLIYDRVPGARKPVALVGITEKAVLGLELHARATGGHASMPPRETAVGILARAIDRIEQHPMPPRLDGAALAMFTTLTPDLSFPMRIAFANLWLLRPVIVWKMTRDVSSNAVVRTTIAPTMLEGSPKINVLATDARALFNVRLLPGDTAEDVRQHVTKTVDDDRVTVTVAGGTNAASPPLSPVSTPEFARLQRAIRAVYPDVLVAPYLTMAATDAREYRDVAPNAYRFLPVQQDGALESIHGVDEHITLEAYRKAIVTYATLMMELARSN